MYDLDEFPYDAEATDLIGSSPRLTVASTETYTRALVAQARYTAEKHPDRATPDLLKHLAEAVEWALNSRGNTNTHHI